jgi:ADP-heptose:LPS heptosyltransferase
LKPPINADFQALFTFVRSGTTVAIGLGAGEKKKQWPVARFVEAGRWLVEQGCQLLLVGGPADQLGAQEFTLAIPAHCRSAAGFVSLLETAALLRECHLYVGNDSGPKHLAAAVGLPVVEVNSCSKEGNLTSRYSPRAFCAWGVKTAIVQPAKALSPCSGECMAPEPHCITQIEVRDVVDAIAEFLSGMGEQADGRRITPRGLPSAS